MKRSYGVVWREGMLPLATGKLEILPRGLRLEGLADARPTSQDVSYDGLAGVRVGRSAGDRIDGRPTVILERRSGLPIAVSTVAQPSLVGEIAEALTALQLGAEATRSTAVVVPLKEGVHDAVRALLDSGPPFDPEKTRGLDRHEVFLTPREAVFVFESRGGASALEPLLAEPELWKAAAAWRDHLAGPPRIAEWAYSWARPPGADHSPRWVGVKTENKGFDFDF